MNPSQYNGGGPDFKGEGDRQDSWRQELGTRFAQACDAYNELLLRFINRGRSDTRASSAVKELIPTAERLLLSIFVIMMGMECPLESLRTDFKVIGDRISAAEWERVVELIGRHNNQPLDFVFRRLKFYAPFNIGIIKATQCANYKANSAGMGHLLRRHHDNPLAPGDMPNSMILSPGNIVKVEVADNTAQSIEAANNGGSKYSAIVEQYYEQLKMVCPSEPIFYGTPPSLTHAEEVVGKTAGSMSSSRIRMKNAALALQSLNAQPYEESAGPFQPLDAAGSAAAAALDILSLKDQGAPANGEEKNQWCLVHGSDSGHNTDCCPLVSSLRRSTNTGPINNKRENPFSLATEAIVVAANAATVVVGNGGSQEKESNVTAHPVHYSADPVIHTSHHHSPTPVHTAGPIIGLRGLSADAAPAIKGDRPSKSLRSVECYSDDEEQYSICDYRVARARSRERSLTRRRGKAATSGHKNDDAALCRHSTLPFKERQALEGKKTKYSHHLVRHMMELDIRDSLTDHASYCPTTAEEGAMELESRSDVKRCVAKQSLEPMVRAYPVVGNGQWGPRIFMVAYSEPHDSPPNPPALDSTITFPPLIIPTLPHTQPVPYTHMTLPTNKEVYIQDENVK